MFAPLQLLSAGIALPEENTALVKVNPDSACARDAVTMKHESTNPRLADISRVILQFILVSPYLCLMKRSTVQKLPVAT